MYERIKMFHLISPLWREGVEELGAGGNKETKELILWISFPPTIDTCIIISCSCHLKPPNSSFILTF